MKNDDSKAPDSSAKEKLPINDIVGWRFLVLLPLCLLLNLWCRTLRFSINDEERKHLSDTDGPAIILGWHNRFFIFCELYKRYRRTKNRSLYGLISASRDGAWVAGFYRLMGLRSVRGSSSRRAIEALGQCISVVNSGNDIGITPDGPRGPRYKMKYGPIYIAEETGADILLASATFHSAWRLKSWDGFHIPKPFSKVTIRCLQFDSIESVGSGPPEGHTKRVEELLDSITDDSPSNKN